MATAAQRRELWGAIHSAHPGLRAALRADARVALRFRGEPAGRHVALDVIRLAWSSDAFLALACYRAKARLQARGIPLAPRLLHRCAMVLAQVCIGDPVVVAAGVYLPHGQVVIDGLVRIGAGASIAPFTTIGLRGGDLVGPRLAEDVSVGTGARLIGPIAVGAGARVGAGAVVVGDVAAGATVVGVPARPV